MLATAREGPALMLVTGSRGLGAFTAMVLGSVARYAAGYASCPVVMVRNTAAAPCRLVGVGVGDLDGCAGPLAFAFEEAALRQATLMAVHAWHAPQAGISRTGTTPTARSPSSPHRGEADRPDVRPGRKWHPSQPGDDGSAQARTSPRSDE
jgi:hypothetical protein